MKRQRGKFRDILTKEFLVREHYLNKRSLKNIGEEVGCDHSTVAYYMYTNRLAIRLHKYSPKNQRHPMWRGYKDISLTYWNNVKNGAKQREIPFNLTIKEGWNLYVKQNKQCALTGRPIAFETSKSNSASLDRIDSKKGYEKRNVQWLHRDVNYAKQSLSNDQFVKLCEEVVNYTRPGTAILHDRQKFYRKPIYWYEFPDCKNIPPGFLNVPSTPYYEFGGPHQNAIEKLETEGFNIVEGAEI